MKHFTNKYLAAFLVMLASTWSASSLVCAGSNGAPQRDEPVAASAQPHAATVGAAEMGRRIHRSIAADPSFSLMAHRIRIVPFNGKIALQGKVANQEERLAIGVRARRIAGPKNVDNQLQIASTR